MVFVVFGLWTLWGSVKKSRWEEVPCTLGKFEIVAAPKASSFRPDLSYTYEYAGQSYTGTRLWPDHEETEDYEKLSDIREPLFMGPEGRRASLEGAAATCRVNRENPAEAVLVLNRTEGFVLGTIFTVMGSLFVMIGLSFLFGSLSVTTRSPAGNSPGAIGTKLVIAPFAFFALAGFGILFGVVVPKAREWFAMRSWQEATAAVLGSKVGSHRGNKGGTTYSIDLFYCYQFDGRQYCSNRYSLLGGSSSGYDGKAKVVNAHPAGSKFQVFVDPEKPWHAVAERSPGWGALFALFPLPFIAIGVAGMWGALRKGKRTASPVSAKSSALRAVPAAGWGSPALVSGEWQPTRLKPGCSLAGMIAIALFWNGIVSIFVVQDIVLYRQGSWLIAIFLTLFLVPFVGIGLLFIGGVVQQFILLFGPRFEIRLDQTELRPGESTTLRWRRSGGRGTVKDVEFLLIGREEDALGNGSSRRSRSRQSVFHEEVLLSTHFSLATTQGHFELKIPEDAVPSFTAGSQSIRWILCLRAKVEGMPDIRDDRDLIVRPPQSSR